MTQIEILAQRIGAFRRWSFAKEDFAYRGEYVSLQGGRHQDRIKWRNRLYRRLEAVFEAIDKRCGHPDQEIGRAWSQWLESGEAREVHMGRL